MAGRTAEIQKDRQTEKTDKDRKTNVKNNVKEHVQKVREYGQRKDTAQTHKDHQNE